MIAFQKLFRPSRRQILLSILLLSGLGTHAETFPPYTAVVPGLDYLHIIDTNHPWSIHVARLDRARAGFEVLSFLARGKMLGLSSVASQAKVFPPGLGKPLVAVNGDFFVIAKGPYQGDPLGLEIMRGELISAPTGASFWVEANGKMGLGTVNSRFRVTWPHGKKLPFGLNEARKTNAAVLYTPSFGSSTRTTNGLELVLEAADPKNWLPLQADKSYSARVREVRGAEVNTPLSPEIAVLSVGPKWAPKFAGLQSGAILKLSTDTSIDVSHAQTAIGGRPILMSHGREGRWTVTGTNTLPRHPRTAIGWNRKYFFFAVVDGRQKGLSMGMNYTEQAHLFKELGCTEAMNLDGGGSTTFWLDGKIMNSPSDKHERSVANALFIVEHGPPPAVQGH